MGSTTHEFAKIMWTLLVATDSVVDLRLLNGGSFVALAIPCASRR